MYFLALLSVLGTAVAVPVSAPVTRQEDLAAQYVLPRDTIPTFYDVRLFINPDYTESFNGSVSIRILPYIATSTITLHAMEMEMYSIQVFSERDPTVDLFSSFTLANDDTHFLRIQLNTPLTILQPVTIHIDYLSRYAENMFGVYVSTYEYNNATVNLVTSQLQPTFARRAFPCYDEPSLKAIFRTTIYAPAAFPVVRSNMPNRQENLKEDVPGYVKHEFEDTLVMSTYLIAYLVSNFDYVENTDSDELYHIPFRVYSRPGTRDTAAFALDFGQRNMVALENYTGFPYYFPKIDKAAVPDFAAGAMENWGLVIYREVALLVQDGVTTTATKQNVARIICHENTHMWYGNEVSPLSWTYTWLNEGFANFFESYGTDLVYPEWRMMDQFVLNMQNVFQSDAVLSVNSMTHPVYTPSQIIGTFNAVAYQKSGSVIRMLQHAMTPEVFKSALTIYITRNSRRVVSPLDLYAALQQGLDNSNHTIPYTINTFMGRWVNQGGFPVLTVTRSSPTAQSVSISQERFLTDRSLVSTDRWHVPVNFVLSTNPDFSNTSPQGWVPPSFPATSFDISGLSEAEWYIVNKQQTGYYRVNYDLQNWAALEKVLLSSHQTIHLLNRAQILDDAFNLARNARLHYDYPFDISRYLVQEKDYVPWAAVNPAFSYLDTVLSSSSVFSLYQDYLKELTAPLYEELGFEASANEEHVTAYHRNIILDINCRHGNEHCVDRAQELLQNFRNNPAQTLNPDIQTLVFCSGLRGGDADNFNFLWNQYLSSTDSSQQSILLNSLGCTSNEELREFYMNQVIIDDSPVREQDRHSIIVSVTNSSPENTDAALDFVIEHFAEIQPRVQGLTGTTNILNAFARRLNSKEHSDKIEEFHNRHQAIFSAGELASIDFIRENIAASITWSNENAEVVEDWLRENYEKSGGNVITSSVALSIGVVIAIFTY